jgi:membrane protein implicated in regulation of membrane protease activity
LFGHGDHGADTHADVGGHEGAGDLHHDDGGLHGEEAWLPFLSVRFWTYFALTFGACGLLLTNFASTREPLTALYATIPGLITGLGVAFAVRLLRRQEVDSSVGEQDLLGVLAKVSVPIREGQIGRVRCTVKGEILDLLARGHEPLSLEAGTEVAIVEMENGTAIVVPKDAIYP